MSFSHPTTARSPLFNIASPSDLLSPSVIRNRERSGSIVVLEEVGNNSLEESQDQGAFPDHNSEWVNRKGAWLMHPLLILIGKFSIGLIPGVDSETSWTITNITYMVLSYLMFHWVTGVPFQTEEHSGAYDDLTLWEQIDGGAQYTPAKKWLLVTPIALFLISTHYTHYEPWTFAICFVALIFNLFPKLPQLHRLRLRVFPPDEDRSGTGTPGTPLTPTTHNTMLLSPSSAIPSSPSAEPVRYMEF
ncbi:Orm1 type endoplasmic reticulum protein [Ramaria rubella]|nr:Orm1 type endoplasmic reticulum protein [Ramaria rubella]